MGSATFLSKDLKIYQNGKVGGLTVDLMNTYHYPGEDLGGNIWINVLQDIEVCGLELKIQMQEGWQYYQDKQIHDENNIQNLTDSSIDIEQKLIKCPSKKNEIRYILPKGVYNFPFKFQIPHYLSPSFEFYDSNESYIRVRYVIYSCLLSTAGEKFSLSNINYLILKAKPNSLESSLTYSSCVNLHSWLVIPKGTCILNVSYLKNNFAFDEVISLKCTIDNSRSKLNVKRLKTTLIQKIYFKDMYKDRTCYENEFQVQEDYLNCKAGTTLNDLIIKIPVENLKLNKEIYKSVGTNTCPYSCMHIFSKSGDIFKFQPTIDSTLIRCEYFIKVSLHFDSFVNYSKRPRVLLPFSLTHSVNDNIVSYEFKDVEKSNNVTNSNLMKINYKEKTNLCTNSINLPLPEFEDINAIYTD